MNRSPRRSRLAAMPVEERTFAFEARGDAPTSENRRFRGHAAVFNQRTAIGDPTRWGFFEECAPGCFDKTLREADVIFNMDHDMGRVLGRTGNGTLRLNADPIGLAVDGDLPDVSYARDLEVLLDRRDVGGMSFQFQVVNDDWTTETHDLDGMPVEVEVRTLKEVRLIDVCTTAIPAYPQTDAAMRDAVSAAKRARTIRRPSAEARSFAEKLVEVVKNPDDRDALRAALEGSNADSVDVQELIDALTYNAGVDDGAETTGPVHEAGHDGGTDDAEGDVSEVQPRSRREPGTTTRTDNQGDNGADSGHSGYDADSLALRQRALAAYAETIDVPIEAQEDTGQ